MTFLHVIRLFQGTDLKHANNSLNHLNNAIAKRMQGGETQELIKKQNKLMTSSTQFKELIIEGRWVGWAEENTSSLGICFDSELQIADCAKGRKTFIHLIEVLIALSKSYSSHHHCGIYLIMLQVISLCIDCVFLIKEG